MTGRAAVLRRMDAEWAALDEDREAAEACRRWAASGAALAGCAGPAEVLSRVAGAPDEVLGHLLGRVGAGDHLAGRVVLQALLPKVVRMASVDRAAEVDDYLTAMWCAIATYPLARRPTSVAANLALDTLKAVHRSRRSLLDVVTAPDVVLLTADRVPGHLVGAACERGPGAAHVLALARHHRLVDPLTYDLLRSVYAEGRSGESVGRRHGLSAAAVRSRCSRAVRVLAESSALLSSAA